MIGIVSDSDLQLELESLGAAPQGELGESPTRIPSSTPNLLDDGDARTGNPASVIVGDSPGSDTGPGVVVDIQRGRGATREIPESLRKLVASTALDGTPASEIAKHLGVSPSSISAYKVGANSTATYNKPDPALLDHVTTKRGKITDKATSKLLLALRNISPEIVQQAKLKELSGLAKDMSTVMRNMDQSANNPLLGGNKGPTYIFYAPRIKKEDEFEVVQALPDEF